MTTATRRKPIRYAVVGLGYIAQIAVLPAFARARRNSRLTALVSGDGQKLAELGDKYDVDRRFSYEEFERCLAEVDAVYLCTPNTEHADFTVMAAAAGVHVLCEKPLAVTDEECQSMVGACNRAGVKLMTAYRLHLNPLTLDVIARVRSGEIGDPRFFSASFSMQATPGGIRTREDTGGGTLFDLGVYCINASRMLFDAEPIRVSAIAVSGARSQMPEIDEMTAAVLHFDGDRLATFTTSFAAAAVSAYRIVGTTGDIRMEPAFEYAEPLRYTMTLDGGKTVKRKRGRKHNQFAAELLYFSDCILNDTSPEPSGAEGAWDVRIVNALYESARSGASIRLPHFSEEGPERDQAMAVPPHGKPALVNVTPPHD